MTQRCKIIAYVNEKRQREKIALFDDAYLLLVEFDFPPNPSHVGFVFVSLFYLIGYAWYGCVEYD